MQINVTGWEDSEQRALIEQYVRTALEYLLVDEENYAHLRIDVFTDLSLIIDDKFGEASVVDEHSEYPCHFRLRLEVKSTTFQEQLLIAGHECVHIKQWSLGHWRPLGEGNHRWWDGHNTTILHESEIDDWEEPWELDARAREKGLLERFVKANGYKQAHWYKNRP